MKTKKITLIPQWLANTLNNKGDKINKIIPSFNNKKPTPMTHTFIMINQCNISFRSISVNLCQSIMNLELDADPTRARRHFFKLMVTMKALVNQMEVLHTSSCQAVVGKKLLSSAQVARQVEEFAALKESMEGYLIKVESDQMTLLDRYDDEADDEETQDVGYRLAAPINK